MVILGITAGAAACAQSAFMYNRKNFMFDRKLRQEQEFTITEYRNLQAELWRQDIEQLMDMTEKKMDKYTVTTALMLDMCIGMFAEGRLEPGVPPWLLFFYMLTLGGAFMYLLMSTWFAIHASVIANCTSVRMLTQFVRLPIPSWKDLEGMRTYASSFESMGVAHAFRVPFTGSKGSVKHHYGEAEEAHSPTQEDDDPPDCCDPWNLEHHGEWRELEELHPEHPAMRKHVELARKAMRQFQAFDAIARLAMNFGIQQLLGAVAYYCIGYAGLQDGALLPAWCLAVIMAAATTAFLIVDFSLTVRERISSELLALMGPLVCMAASTYWALNGEYLELCLRATLPVVCLSHGVLLCVSLARCGLREQVTGIIIPTRFRGVLYLDVFGWLREQQGTPPASPPTSRDAGREFNFESRSSRASVLPRQADVYRRSRQSVAVSVSEVPYAESTATLESSPHTAKSVRDVPAHVFSPDTYSPLAAKTGESRGVDPYSFPAKVFRKGTILLFLLWMTGVTMFHQDVMRFMAKPVKGDVLIEGEDGSTIHYDTQAGYMPVSFDRNHGQLPQIPLGENLRVDWPFSKSFFPHAMGADTFGKQLILVNDLGMYSGKLHGHFVRHKLLQQTPHATDFQRMLPCNALQGHHRADFSIVCAPQTLHASRKVCFIFVLDEGGQRLVQCPMAEKANRSMEETLGHSAEEGEASAHSWEISKHWLHADEWVQGREEWGERVVSMAVNGNCFLDAGGGRFTFDANGLGCVVVGTTIGRIVQLRGSINNPHVLVPDRSLYRRGQAVLRGTLQILLSGYVVALRRRDRDHGRMHASVQAFDILNGSLVGEWLLPDSAKWLTFSGAGNSLFAMGLESHDNMALHSFPVPDELLVVKQFTG